MRLDVRCSAIEADILRGAPSRGVDRHQQQLLRGRAVVVVSADVVESYQPTYAVGH
ncbi:hypothetical protein KDK95_16580 [Actinospica sp. MGRD01-02]|uniref:Uncharacterized protein n=1 Tax=Actinospica acidithermotolerans TaxID=2828514 RepID=A0A941ECM8_9ACTN|nr:hypothetical protein [Actinospica acidithermotolerans]MBR7827935.1 hypothetical protein [Actinospica acidithermotolerans]